MSDNPIICDICGLPVKSEFEKFADEAANIVHQACYENKSIEAARKPIGRPRYQFP